MIHDLLLLWRPPSPCTGTGEPQRSDRIRQRFPLSIIYLLKCLSDNLCKLCSQYFFFMFYDTLTYFRYSTGSDPESPPKRLRHVIQTSYSFSVGLLYFRCQPLSLPCRTRFRVPVLPRNVYASWLSGYADLVSYLTTPYFTSSLAQSLFWYFVNTCDNFLDIRWNHLHPLYWRLELRVGTSTPIYLPTPYTLRSPNKYQSWP